MRREEGREGRKGRKEGKKGRKGKKEQDTDGDTNKKILGDRVRGTEGEKERALLITGIIISGHWLRYRHGRESRS